PDGDPQRRDGHLGDPHAAKHHTRWHGDQQPDEPNCAGVSGLLIVDRRHHQGCAAGWRRSGAGGGVPASTGVTWLRRNCGSNAWSTAGGDVGSLITSTTVTTTNGAVNFTVTSWVQSVVDGATNNGLLLRASTE